MAFDWGRALAGAGRGMQRSAPMIMQALMAQQEQENWQKKFDLLEQERLDQQAGTPTEAVGLSRFGMGDYDTPLTRHLTATKGGEPMGVDPTAMERALAAQEQISPLDRLKLQEKEIDIKTKEAKLQQLLNPSPKKTKQKYDYLETAKYEDYQKYVAKQKENREPVKSYSEWARTREHSPTAGAGRDVIFGRTGRGGGEKPLTPAEKAELEERRRRAGK